MTIRVRLVDLGALGQLSIRLETPGLVGAVFEYDVALFVLVVAQREEDDVALVDPDFFAEFALQDYGLVAGPNLLRFGVLFSLERRGGELIGDIPECVLIVFRRRSRGLQDARCPAS